MWESNCLQKAGDPHDKLKDAVTVGIDTVGTAGMDGEVQVMPGIEGIVKEIFGTVGEVHVTVGIDGIVTVGESIFGMVGDVIVGTEGNWKWMVGMVWIDGIEGDGCVGMWGDVKVIVGTVGWVHVMAGMDGTVTDMPGIEGTVNVTPGMLTVLIEKPGTAQL